MAAPIVIPFNNNPASSSVRSASYTIPAGKYAYFTAGYIYFSESLGTNPATQTRTAPLITVDGVSIDHDILLNVTATNTAVSTRTITYNLGLQSSENRYVYSSSPSTAASFTISLNCLYGETNTAAGSNSTVVTTSNTFGLVNTLTMTITGALSNSINLTARVNIGCINKTKSWLPSGTVIAVTNGTASYRLEEYNQIS